MNGSDQTTKHNRVEALLAKRALIERQLKAIAARQNAAHRKAEQRARFLLGAVVLDRAASEPQLLERCCTGLTPKEQQHVRGVVELLRLRKEADADNSSED